MTTKGVIDALLAIKGQAVYALTRLQEALHNTHQCLLGSEWKTILPGALRPALLLRCLPDLQMAGGLPLLDWHWVASFLHPQKGMQSFDSDDLRSELDQTCTIQVMRV